MMLKLVNAALIVAVLGSAFGLYSLEHATRGLEREIKKTRADIEGEVEATKLLNAEWSNLTRPDRIQKLAEEHLGMTVVTSEQIVREEELEGLLARQQSAESGSKAADPIADILKKMQQ